MTESYKIDNDVLFRWIVGKVYSERKEGEKTKEEGEKWNDDKERKDEKERINGERKGKKEWREETIYKGDEAVERRKEKGSKFRVQSMYLHDVIFCHDTRL